MFVVFLQGVRLLRLLVLVSELRLKKNMAHTKFILPIQGGQPDLESDLWLLAVQFCCPRRLTKIGWPGLPWLQLRRRHASGIQQVPECNL